MLAESGAPNTDAFPARLACWLAANHELISSLAALRRLGAEGAEAVATVLNIKRVAVMRRSLDLWSAMADAEGHDADRLLARCLPDSGVEHLRFALNGGSADPHRLLNPKTPE